MIPDLRKPSIIEGKETMTPRQRKALLDKHCESQGMLCVTCTKPMTRKPYHMNTATLGHDKPEPMGCKKRDNPDNILGAQCWTCNTNRGSRRD